MKKKIYLDTRIRYGFCFLWAFVAILTAVLAVCAKDTDWIRPVVVISIVIQAAGGYCFYRFVFLPYKSMGRIYQLYADGYFGRMICDYHVQVDRDVERAEYEILGSLDKGELLSLSKKQAEYLALQNQINPHFLYNTLEGIRSEAILAGMDSVAEMTEALATFFRYTISKVDHLVTLEDELANIENYYVIQQYRFGDRLSLSIEYDEEEEEEMEALECLIPKLTLQPIVENSIYHGLEGKIGKGHLTIRIVRTSERLLITVSDDGLGMEQDKLDEMNRKMSKAPLEDVQVNSEKRGGIAMVNVNNRIKLLFGEKYGLYFYSTPGVGTDVEVSLPVITESTEKGRGSKRHSGVTR